MKFFPHTRTPGLPSRHLSITALAVPLLLPIAGLPAQDFTYTNNNGALTITGYTGAGGNVTIPSTIDGLPVTSVGDSAFWQTASLTNLSIPDSVTSIGDGAFDGCQNLASVTIGNGLASIGYAAFNFCTSLTSISIPDSVTNIKDGFNSIGGGGAFSYCASLTNVMVGNSVTNIGDWAFYLCTSLRSVYCRGNAPRAGTGLFFNTSNVTVYYVPDTTGWEPTFGGRPTALWNQAQDFTYTTNNGTLTITGYNGPGGDVAIPSTIADLPVTSIGDGAFAGLTSLTGVSIPDSVTNLGEQAFNGCSSLESLTIGNGITIIRGGADNGLGGTFENCTRLTRVTIPDSVTNIGDGPLTVGGPLGAFFYCTSLTNVTVGRGLTYLGLGAFSWCTNLVGVYFRGNAPTPGQSQGFGEEIFYGTPAIAYYVPGTTGWGPTFATIHTALWNPLAQTGDGSFGVRQNHFGFNIAGTKDIPLVVEASTNIPAGLWVPLQMSTLTNGLFYFSDSQWTNYPSRLYRIRSP